jgi:hypothetical protein
LGIYPGDCRVVEEREAVPEDVSVGGFGEDCALADAKFGGGGEGVEVGIGGVDWGPGVGVGSGEVGPRGPGLAGGGDVLAGVLLSVLSVGGRDSLDGWFYVHHRLHSCPEVCRLGGRTLCRMPRRRGGLGRLVRTTWWWVLPCAIMSSRISVAVKRASGAD